MNTGPEILARERRSSSLKLVVAWALAALFLFLALCGIDWSAVIKVVRQGRLDFLFLAFLTFTGTYFLRGIRWRVLLSAEKVLSPWTAFWGVCVGYLGNNFLPARAGELIRSALIAKRTEISISFALATALTERLVDVPVLVILGLLALPIVPGIPDWIVGAVRVMTLLSVVGMSALLVAPRLDAQLAALIRRLPLNAGWHQRAINATNQFLQGTRAFQHPARAFRFLLLTLVIWSLDTVGTIWTAAAFGFTLTPAESVLLLTALGLSSAVPSTPGYVGIYQFVALTVLPPFGFTQNSALVFILTLQALTYSVSIVFGLIGLRQLNGRFVPLSGASSPPAPGEMSQIAPLTLGEPVTNNDGAGN
jgi:uncharacterized protein (TIRG00374 family)